MLWTTLIGHRRTARDQKNAAALWLTVYAVGRDLAFAIRVVAVLILRGAFDFGASAHIQAGPTTRPDPDHKVRTALDRAAEKIGKRFADQPIIEASIRHTIGDAYYLLGLYTQALRHLERGTRN